MISVDKLLEYLFIDEMPIRQFNRVGNWDRRSSFGSDVDRRLLTSPKAVEKIHKQWEKTPYTFDIFLVNDPRVNKPEFREVGSVDIDFVRNKMKISPEEIPDPDSDAITIIFTNNVGDQRYMASGWILAHRLGHALNRGGGKVSQEWQEFSRRLRELFVEILDQVYDVTVPKDGFSGQGDKILRHVAHQLASMKSARDKNLRNWYELSYELLAQYLITGKITFNPLPDKLVTHIGSWGHKRSRGVMSPQTQQMYNNHDLQYYANELEQMVENVLDRAIGRIFVM